MAGMYSRTAGVWEHIEDVILGLRCIAVNSRKRLVGLPEPLPLLFNRVKVITACFVVHLQLPFRVGTTVVAAAGAFFRPAFFDLGRKHGQLFCEFAAAAMSAFSNGLVTAAFKQFGYLAAIAAFIFVNRHALPRSYG
jgi:hypothetical protein